MSEESRPTRDMLIAWQAAVARSTPFLRWAGGKRRFLQRFSHLLPDFQGRYFEPFLGGGSVFFHIMRTQSRPCEAFLGDTNHALIAAYTEVRDNPVDLVAQLEELQSGYLTSSSKKDFYGSARDLYNSRRGHSAAEFIFLNRTCWNGLYRVNGSGEFNVPYGAPKTEQVIPDRSTILNASAALTLSTLRSTSWQNTLAGAAPGDFVFLDPPYYSDIVADDRKYSSRSFTLRHHEEVANAVESLQTRGIDFVLTNSAEREIVDLYSGRGFHVDTVRVPRAINSKTDRRGGVPELIVRPGFAAAAAIPTQLGMELSVAT